MAKIQGRAQKEKGVLLLILKYVYTLYCSVLTLLYWVGLSAWTAKGRFCFGTLSAWNRVAVKAQDYFFEEHIEDVWALRRYIAVSIYWIDKNWNYCIQYYSCILSRERETLLIGPPSLQLSCSQQSFRTFLITKPTVHNLKAWNMIETYTVDNFKIWNLIKILSDVCWKIGWCSSPSKARSITIQMTAGVKTQCKVIVMNLSPVDCLKLLKGHKEKFLHQDETTENCLKDWLMHFSEPISAFFLMTTRENWWKLQAWKNCNQKF